MPCCDGGFNYEPETIDEYLDLNQTFLFRKGEKEAFKKTDQYKELEKRFNK